MIAFLTGIRMKLAIGGAVIVVLVLGYFLAMAQVHNRHLTKVNASLDQRINDPVTGLVVQLAQATTNTETLKVQVERQTTVWKTRSAEDSRRLADTTRKLVIAQAATRKAQAAAGRFLAVAPRGDTTCERVLDVDTRLLETLK